jgi:hypothetical protein
LPWHDGQTHLKSGISRALLALKVQMCSKIAFSMSLVVLSVHGDALAEGAVEVDIAGCGLMDTDLAVHELFHL